MFLHDVPPHRESSFVNLPKPIAPRSVIAGSLPLHGRLAMSGPLPQCAGTDVSRMRCKWSGAGCGVILVPCVPRRS